MGGMLLFTALFGAGLWYSTNYAYYQKDTGVTEVAAFGQNLPVSQYQSIDANTSPLKMRACFTANWDVSAYSAYRVDAGPLIAPTWFDCFNAGQIAKDIAAGSAIVLRAEKNQPYGFDRYIALYPDGRAFMWRLINLCGDAKFSGEELPEGCDEPIESGALTPQSDLRKPTIVASVQPAKLPEPTPQKPVLHVVSNIIRLMPLIGDGPEEIATGVVEAMGDLTASLGFHGCFEMPQSFGLLTETYETAEPTNPQTPPGGLSCFNAEQLAEDLQIGYAIAFWGERNITPGVDRVVAVYGDGRAFVWHQSNQNHVE